MTTPSSFAEDLALVQRALANDASARQQLVRRLLPRAQRLCLALLHNTTDAKDASQAALLQVLRSIHTYGGQCSLEHWSDRVVSRTALRWKKAERRARPVPLQGAEAPVAGGAPAHTLARECLEKLPETQRTALVLRSCFDYSVDEVAELTGVSRNTVKDRLLRAKRSLRTLVRVGPGKPGEASETSTLSAAFSLPTTH